MTGEVTLVPALKDNYIYLIQWNNQALIVDPGEAEPVFEALDKRELTLHTILNTHHHWDHTNGNAALKKATGSRLIAPDDPRITQADQQVAGGDEFEVGPFQIKVIDVPGHTVPHVAYYFPQQKWVFTGDSLFAGGCGRIFEGNMEQMLASLQRITKLPEDTLVFSGHEYTLNNLRFDLSVDPDNVDLQKRLEKVKEQREGERPTIPTTLNEELLTNPFLRTADPQLKASLGMLEANEVEVFTELRQRKDRF